MHVLEKLLSRNNNHIQYPVLTTEWPQFYNKNSCVNFQMPSIKKFTQFKVWLKYPVFLEKLGKYINDVEHIQKDINKLYEIIKKQHNAMTNLKE